MDQLWVDDTLGGARVSQVNDRRPESSEMASDSNFEFIDSDILQNHPFTHHTQDIDRHNLNNHDSNVDDIDMKKKGVQDDNNDDDDGGDDRLGRQDESEMNVPLLSAEDKSQAGFSAEPSSKSSSLNRRDSKIVLAGKLHIMVPVDTDEPALLRGNELKQRPHAGAGEGWRRSLYAASKDVHPKDKKDYKTLNCPCVTIPLWEMEMTKKELVKTYRIHIFVCFIFLITALSVGMSWYYRNSAYEELLRSQAIFFDPRTRELTLADPSNTLRVRGKLGLDINPWQLPLHCPVLMEGNPHSKECLWKKKAVLRLMHFGNDRVQCYNVSWESLDPMHVPHDCFDISTDLWYGPSNNSDKTLPIRGTFQFQPVNYTIGNNGLFSSVVEFYWLSSSGAALRVNADDPIQITWNASGDNQLCVISNYTGPLYHQKNAVTYSSMNYTLCNGFDPLITHTYMQSMYAPAKQVTFPPKQVIHGRHWSLKSIARTENVTQDHVLDLVTKVTDHGFKDNIITIDGNWQRVHGDLVFDSERFSNLTAVSDSLKLNDCLATISISPYFQYKSDNFHHGVDNSLFVKDAGGEVTGLTNFQGGLAAALDVFRDEGISWYRSKLQETLGLSDLKSYRLTYGLQAWLPYKPHFELVDGTPNMYRKLLTEALAAMSDSLTVEHTSDSRHVSSLLPVATDLELLDDKLCLSGAIETALTLGLLGYPFVMADGIRTTSKAIPQRYTLDGRPSRELYIRWLQLASFFPAFQFSTAPWEYDEEVVQLAKNISAQRENLVLAEFQDETLIQEVGQGYPILRPVWWVDPKNITVHKMEINDEFLVGNNLLVAPVLCEDVMYRDIYVPPGVWEDLRDGTFILGPATLRRYQTPPHRIAVFIRREVVGDGMNQEL